MKSEAKPGKATKDGKDGKESKEAVEVVEVVPGEEQLTISEMENVTTVFRPHRQRHLLAVTAKIKKN